MLNKLVSFFRGEKQFNLKTVLGMGSFTKGKLSVGPLPVSQKNEVSVFSPSRKKETLDFIEEATTEFDANTKSFQ